MQRLTSALRDAARCSSHTITSLTSSSSSKLPGHHRITECLGSQHLLVAHLILEDNSCPLSSLVTSSAASDSAPFLTRFSHLKSLTLGADYNHPIAAHTLPPTLTHLVLPASLSLIFLLVVPIIGHSSLVCCLHNSLI